ncbi:hypothetical protein [Poseidonibacter sp.]|uniref:hypothetical protein n=1 Tax=Poseidonibacter sp. TaxID=2321188 RepID=UPI003C76EBE5
MKEPVLYAPLTFHNASCEEKKKVCNGCGAKDGVNVPNTMYGLDISQACHIHDWMFEEGKTLADFIFANAMFIVNLTRIIVHKSANKFMVSLRLLRASKYFTAVVLYGHEAYWKNKTENRKMNITYKGEFR